MGCALTSELDKHASPRASWPLLHRPAAVCVAGVRADAPRYRVVTTAPEGQYTQPTVVRADGGRFEDVAPRVWVFSVEMPDGQWGGRDGIQRLEAIHARLFSGEPARIKIGRDARKTAQGRLAKRRRQKAREPLDAVQQGTAVD
jgi:hypothetical protein